MYDLVNIEDIIETLEDRGDILDADVPGPGLGTKIFMTTSKKKEGTSPVCEAARFGWGL